MVSNPLQVESESLREKKQKNLGLNEISARKVVHESPAQTVLALVAIREVKLQSVAAGFALREVVALVFDPTRAVAGFLSNSTFALGSGTKMKP